MKDNYKELYLYKGFGFVIDIRNSNYYGYAEIFHSVKNPQFSCTHKTLGILKKRFRKYVDSLPEEAFNSYELHDMDWWGNGLNTRESP